MKPFFAFYDRMMEVEEGVHRIAPAYLQVNHPLGAIRFQWANYFEYLKHSPLRSIYGNNQSRN
jgi:hypothetical protein